MTGSLRRLTLPRTGSWFEGHFPGRPILPGVAHLALLGKPITSVISLRLRVPLGPGDTIEVAERPGAEPGRLLASVRRGGFVASRAVVTVDDGTATLADPGDEPAEGPAEASSSLAIPHRPPIRCLERVLEWGDDVATCRVRLPASGAFVDGGRIPAFFALECAAQAAAAWEAWTRAEAGGFGQARLGYLVGARNASFASAFLPAGARGTVRIRLDAAAPPLAIYAFTLTLGRLDAATGTVHTWITATGA